MAELRAPPARCSIRAAVLGALLLICVTDLRAETDAGGDFRLYPFYLLDDADLDVEQRWAALAVLRGKLRQGLGGRFRLEAHAVAEVSSSPGFSGSTSIVTGSTRRYFDLDWDFLDSEDVLGTASFDRLNVRYDGDAVRVIAGRQAVTWGVSYFWPVLDLFAPFAPERIDRDYKPGVDALRTTVPVGAFSEIELIGAIQGESIDDDGSLAGLGRFNLGRSDLGFMAGHFHGDDVVGIFAFSDARGTALRLEASHTRSVEELDRFLDREEFVRATLGADRQLTPSLFLSLEAHWNGFGADDPADYIVFAQADRIQRGEVTSLARTYFGASLSWQLHPLVSFAGALLGNLGDGSVLALPNVSWSSSDNGTVQAGLLYGFGDGFGLAQELPDEEGDLTAPILGSEFGVTPLTIWFSYKIFF